MNNLFDQDHWIYEVTPDNKYRYILGERGTAPLICIGVNPSTATPEKLDPTLRNVKAWSKRLGYDGWIMLNLYPQRATNPKDLPQDWDIIHVRRNQCAFYMMLNEFRNATVWAAWGTIIEQRPYLVKCLQKLIEIQNEFGHRWITIGQLSKDGHPHHPLYLSQKSAAETFNYDNYLWKQGV